ncbi:hypothetical protein ON010_g13468 [Phytophthora cinnamomi]|nr:hypothetical protein ON010_g13468 [Phytophthora cinnamomi]
MFTLPSVFLVNSDSTTFYGPAFNELCREPEAWPSHGPDPYPIGSNFDRHAEANMATIRHGADSLAPPIQRSQAQGRTPTPGTLSSADVRGACTAPSTKKAYKSYIKDITKWIKEKLPSPESYFYADGGINVEMFKSSHFETVLLEKMNSKPLKVSLQENA